MRPLLILILSFSLSIAAFGQQDSLGFTNKAEAKNQMVHGLKEGKWVEYIDIMGNPTNNSKKEYIYTLTVYKTGKPFGVARSYYCDGDKLLRVFPYINGEVNGVAKWYYESGGLLCETLFKDGKENGLSKKYAETGELTDENMYAKGMQNGISRSYYFDGELFSEATYINDSKVFEKTYYKNGKVKYEDSTDNCRNSYGYAKNEVQKEYYENGVLENEAYFSYGNYIWSKKGVL